LDDFEGIVPMSLDDFGASEGVPLPESSGFFEDSEIDFDIRIEDPDAVQIGGGPPTVAPAVFSGGGSLSNASGLDDEFPELPEVDEPGGKRPVAEVDRPTVILGADATLELSALQAAQAEEAPAPQAAREQPASVPSGTGFTRLLGELGNEGLAPFDPARTTPGMGGASSAEAGDNPAFPSLADGWDEIDAQLASATPGGGGSDELLDIDELGLEPFTLDDDEMDFVTFVDPVGKTAPPARAETAPTPLDQLLEAHSQAAQPAQAADAGAMDEDDLIRGIEPFSIEDFDDVDGTSSFEFGVLPWEQQEGAAGLDVQELLAEVTELDAPAEPAHEPEVPDAASEYLDINHELTSGSLDPHFERRMAEVEEAARQNLDRLNRDRGREPEEAVAAVDVGAAAPDPEGPHTNVVTPTAEYLVTDAAMFQRTRIAKTEMIEQGTLKGDREFAAVEHAPQAAAPTPPPAPEPVAPPLAEEPAVEADEPETAPYGAASTGEADHDVDALRDAVTHHPRDDDARWAFAEVLRERGDIHAAFTEYRWLIRHAPGRHNAIIAALEQCAYEDQEADLAHRLLADIYRRRGDSSQARNHASMAMATRRLMREIRM
jgi:hypothetical protein